jgi:hypothetical protein
MAFGTIGWKGEGIDQGRFPQWKKAAFRNQAIGMQFIDKPMV